MITSNVRDLHKWCFKKFSKVSMLIVYRKTDGLKVFCFALLHYPYDDLMKWSMHSQEHFEEVAENFFQSRKAFYKVYHQKIFYSGFTAWSW